ncbi:MAG: ABC transporter ATP-binding protein, partial [Candidatus Thorarchaeota archaeon]
FLLGVLIPLIIGDIIDFVSVPGAISDVSHYSLFVLYGVLLIIGLYIIRGSSGFAGRYLNGKCGESVIFRLREDLFTKLQHQDQEFYDTTSTGSLMTRATTDMEQLQELFFFGFRALLQGTSVFLFTFLFIFLIDYRLFFILLLATPILLLVIVIFPRKLQPAFYSARKEYANLTSIIEENITGARIVRAFSAQENELKKFNMSNDEYLDRQINAYKIRAIYLPLMVLVINFMAAIALIVSAWLVINHILSVGKIATMMTYFVQLYIPTRFLSQSIVSFQRARAASDRIVPILFSEPSIHSNPYALTNIEEIKSIEFKNVSFIYPRSSNRKVIDGLSFKVNKGQTVAIIGPTGSGKSTIGKLLTRMYDIQEGNILINNGIDIRQIDLKTLRENISMVHQEVFLFSRSLYDNLTFIGKDVEPESIDKILSIAQIDEFIPILENGLDTKLGERGVNLSGGQKQRVSLGRALIKNSPIIVLDDFSSAIDVEIEAEIHKRVKEDFHDKIIIIITQRLSSLRLADRVIILNQGKIVEEGTHDELLALEGIYAKLWKSQETGIIDFELLFNNGNQIKNKDLLPLNAKEAAD